MQTTLKEFYPKGARESPDYGRIVNARSFSRLKEMLASTHGKIIIGGTTDEATLFFEPTVVLVSNASDPLLADESFGPLMPILAVPDLDTAIRTAESISSTPLGVYPFGAPKDTTRVLDMLRSGGATINDGFNHAAVPTLAFGGVGESGQGSYRGRSSFECFTHRRSVVSTPKWMEALLKVRYPPFEGTGKLKQYRRMADMKPNFDREGRETFSLLWFLAALGGKSGRAGLLRWLSLAAIALGWQSYGVGLRGLMNLLK